MKDKPDCNHRIDYTVFDRRQFLKTSAAAGAGIIFGQPDLWADDKLKVKIKTNIDDALSAKKSGNALPGPFPGRVVQVYDSDVTTGKKVNQKVLDQMFYNGLQRLTGLDAEKSFQLMFIKDDIVGLKVNPVGPGLINTHLELVDSVIQWLTSNGLPREQIVIWDRFDYMLTNAGFVQERFPGIHIEGLQTMDEEAITGDKDDTGWLDASGRHISLNNFDKEAYYWADIAAPDEKAYLNQHVVNTRYSYFGKLVTRKLTKIINLPVFKNTGNGISMATKNLGYGAICNTGRLHRPLFFDVCTEVLAFPAIRNKLVLNITDGIRAQYDGGPMASAEHIYEYKTLFFATDPFALDSVCHRLMVTKRKKENVPVNEHPRFTEYLRYAEKLGLGIADPGKIEHLSV